MTKEDILNSEDGYTVTLELEDDSTVECEVVTIVSAVNKDFIALLPLEGPDAESGDVYLYEFRETQDGDPDLIEIASDEEYEAACDAFDEYLDSVEFDELVVESDPTPTEGGTNETR